MPSPPLQQSATRVGALPWHLATALVGLVSLGIQLVLTIRGVNVLIDDATGRPAANTPTRVLRFFSYFTVESNVIVIVTTLMLARDPERDGRWFRVGRIAGLIGIFVTFVVYLVALRPFLKLSGLAAVTDTGFHIVTPLLAVGGWVIFGPRPRFERSTLLWSLAWPGIYFVYSLIHGGITGWYPYPFVDIGKIGYPSALLNLAVVAVLLLVVGTIFVWLDTRLKRTSNTVVGDSANPFE
jgi:hypothetical protein